MPGRFKYEKLVKYPHLKPEEVPIWERFIDLVPDAYQSVDYDVGVGDVSEAKEVAEKLEIAGAEATFQYKIDVVGFAAGRIDIIDIKPRAHPAANGQVKGYVTMFKKKFNPREILRPVIIAGDKFPEAESLAAEAGVALIIV